MYICICKAITDTQIRAAVDNGANSVCKLRKKFGLASSCGSCIAMTESILKENPRKKSNTNAYVASVA
ncbi:MAG: (2Fe-2S)-binding protein [Pseudomonadota bacterium]|nr:(2Fe-2S)-binding protein [Pseudomonadota bacterium]